MPEEDKDCANEEIKVSSWIDDKDLSKGTVGSLEPEEENFWEKLILKYLKPLDNDKNRETMVKTLLSVNFFRNFLNFVIDSLFFFLVEFTDAERPKKA